jgi:hypothetical protein
MLIVAAPVLLLAGAATAGQKINALECKDGLVARSDGNGWVCSDGTLGNLSCSSGQVAKFSRRGWVCADDNDSGANTTALQNQVDQLSDTVSRLPPNATSGFLWLDHFNLTGPITSRVATERTIGVDLSVTKSSVLQGPPWRDFISMVIPALSPGFYLDGRIRVCYGIIGTSAETKIDVLRLSQFRQDQVDMGSGVPGYTNLHNDPPDGVPPPGSSNSSAANFDCVDIDSTSNSNGPVCIDPSRGPLMVSLRVQIGALTDTNPTDIVFIRALGVGYDLTLPGGAPGCPNP